MNKENALVVFEDSKIRRTWFNDEWYTPGYYTSGKDLYLLNGEVTPWTAEQLVVERNGRIRHVARYRCTGPVRRQLAAPAVGCGAPLLAVG